MEQSDATICIPGYGPAHLTDKCLINIAVTCGPAGVLVWDNGIDHQDLSNEVGVEETRLLDQVMARSEAGRQMAKGVWNVGFAEACNRMAAAAKTDLFVFLNCDTEPQPGWLEALVRAFDDPGVGIAGSRLIKPDGELIHSGVGVVLGESPWTQDLSKDLPTRDVDAVTGACVAIRRDVFEALEGFDQLFWNLFEDGDFCLRARQAGWRIRYVRESLVIHHYKATGSERWDRAWQQVQRFQNKWKNADLELIGPYG